MKKLDLKQMEVINGGIYRSERNAGCAALGLAAGLASFWNPFCPAIVWLLSVLYCLL
jgi:hypothetical protein